MLKRTAIVIISLLTAAIATLAATDNATKTLDAVATKIRTAKSLTANYTLSGSAQISGSGSITLAGDRFAMTSPQISVWYDGKSQWTYSAANNEVNLTEPTPQELAQVNPFVIINTFRQAYNAKTLSKTKTTAKIQLTAKNKTADITSAIITVDLATNLPSEIRLTTASGQTATIAITAAKTGAALNIATFRFPKAKYPKAELIDLR